MGGKVVLYSVEEQRVVDKYIQQKIEECGGQVKPKQKLFLSGEVEALRLELSGVNGGRTRPINGLISYLNRRARKNNLGNPERQVDYNQLCQVVSEIMEAAGKRISKRVKSALRENVRTRKALEVELKELRGKNGRFEKENRVLAEELRRVKKIIGAVEDYKKLDGV